MRFPIFAALMAPNDGTTMPACITAARTVAQRLQGPLSIAVGAIEIKTPVILARATVGGLISAENKRCRENAEAVCASLKGSLAPATPGISCDVVIGELPELRQSFASRARLHGLAVTQTGEGHDLLQLAIVETLLFESGRPVLVVPHDFHAALSFDTVLIAWDGSHAAARALWNAMPLLQGSKRVIIACVTGEKDLGAAVLGSDIGKTLASTGFNVEAVTLPMSEVNVAETLIKHAGQISAGLLVLGAYGHARWREFVFGGVTRGMLATCEIPMLMSN